MTREAIIANVKKRYAEADLATIDAVLRTLQESGHGFEQAGKPLSTARQAVHHAPKAVKPDLRFVGENLSSEAYRKLSFEERGELKERLKEQNSEWLEEKFTALHAAWLMVLDGEVIASGEDLASYPQTDQIRESSLHHGKRPFVFINDLFVAIEETAWHRTVYPNDFYPAVSITLSTNSGTVEIIADVDSGASSSFVDYDLVFSHKVIALDQEDEIESSMHLSRPFRYVSKLITAKVKTATGEVLSQELPIHCVVKWNKSPFVAINHQRTALAGRSIFLRLQPSLMLDYRNRRTEVYVPQTL